MTKLDLEYVEDYGVDNESKTRRIELWLPALEDFFSLERQELQAFIRDLQKLEKEIF